MVWGGASWYISEGKQGDLVDRAWHWDIMGPIFIPGSANKKMRFQKAKKYNVDNELYFICQIYGWNILYNSMEPERLR